MSDFDGLLGGELCRACGRISRVGFHVPDPIWNAARHGYPVLCVVCFGAFADERLLDWDRDITFYPVSQVTSMRAQGWTLAPLRSDQEGAA